MGVCHVRERFSSFEIGSAYDQKSHAMLVLRRDIVEDTGPCAPRIARNCEAVFIMIAGI